MSAFSLPVPANGYNPRRKKATVPSKVAMPEKGVEVWERHSKKMTIGEILENKDKFIAEMDEKLQESCKDEEFKAYVLSRFEKAHD